MRAAGEPPSVDLNALGIKKWLIGASLCITLVAGAIPIAVGGWLIAVGREFSTATCEGPLSAWAETQGSLLVSGAVLALLVMGSFLTFSLNDADDILAGDIKKPVRIPSCLEALPFWSLSGTVSRGKAYSYSVLFVASTLGSWLGVASLGVLIWGAVISFRGDLWNRMRALSSGPNPPTDPAAYPCAPGLYYPAAVFIIVLFALFLAVVAIAVCLFICVAAVAAAICACECCGCCSGLRWSRRAGSNRANKKGDDLAGTAEGVAKRYGIYFPGGKDDDDDADLTKKDDSDSSVAAGSGNGGAAAPLRRKVAGATATPQTTSSSIEKDEAPATEAEAASSAMP